MTSLLHFSIAHLLCFSQFRVLCEGWGAGLALSQGEPTVGMGRPPSLPSRNQQDPGQTGQSPASSRSGKGALTFARPLAAARLLNAALGHPHTWVWVPIDFQEGGTCLQPFLTPGQTWVYTSFDFTVPSLT